MKLRKIIVPVLCGVLLVFAGIVAASESAETEHYYIDWEWNPLYEAYLSPEEAETALGGMELPEEEADNATAAVSYWASLDDAAAVLRDGLVARKAEIVVGYQAKGSYDVNEIFADIFNRALLHTGDSDEGDYLVWHWTSRSGSVTATSGGSVTLLKFTFGVTYYTTAAQEATVADRVNTILNSLNLNGKSEYEKIRGIYDYICKNVTYDYDKLNDSAYKLKFSCYAAIVNNTAVCQGYASMFYRLALEAGLDARVIYGQTGGGVAHAWNIVRIGDTWFHLDSTWDAGMTDYRYFLKGIDDFPDHIRLTLASVNIYYPYASFYAAYPMARTAYIDITVPNGAVSGACGDGVFWELKADGRLVVYGEGSVADYASAEEAPWSAYAPAVREVYIDEGVTAIGSNAFAGCTAVQTFHLPDSVTETAPDAFPSDAAAVRVDEVALSLTSGTGWQLVERADGRRFLVAKSDGLGIIAFTEKFVGGTGSTANLFRIVSADGTDIYSAPTAVRFGMRLQRINSDGGVTDEVTLALWGDMNLDGVVNRVDAIALLWSFMKPETYGDVLQYDLNGDGDVNVADATYHMQSIAG